MARLINRGLSLLIYIGYIVAAYVSGAGILALKTAELFLIPMACIWFFEAGGGFTGMITPFYPITEPTPAFLMCAVGWLLLVGAPIMVYLIANGA